MTKKKGGRKLPKKQEKAVKALKKQGKSKSSAIAIAKAQAKKKKKK